MNPSITDWMQAITAIVTSVLGLIGATIAIYQVIKIKDQMKASTLTNILSLESEMNIRKAKLDDINNEIQLANHEGKLNDNLKEILGKYHDAAIENWLNSVDRLCFCIQKDYLKEKDWKSEYRDYIVEIVKNHEKKFGPSSKYNNIIDLNGKWLRE